jgi:hypothetical protein
LLLIDNMEYGAATRGNRERLGYIQGVACGVVAGVSSFVETASPRSGSIAMRFGVSVFIDCGGSHESINFSSILLLCLADQMSSKV